MRILHCIRSLDPSGGGPADFVRSVALFQKEFSIEIEAVCLDEPGCSWIAEFPCTVHALGPVRGTYGFSRTLVRWLEQNLPRFDVTVVNGTWTFISAAVRKAANRTGRPYVIFTNGMLDPWFATRYPLKHLKKVLYWKLIEHKVLQDASATFFTSNEEASRAAGSFKPFQTRSIVVPYGTIDPLPELEESRRDFIRQFQHLSSLRFLLYLGRIHDKKGIDLLLQSYQQISDKYPDTHMLIVGPIDKSYSAKFAGLLRSLNQRQRDRVHHLEFLSGRAKWGALSSAEALVLPSHQENFARVVSESLSCSTPVLLSNKVNIWRDIEEHAAGFIENDDLKGTMALLDRWCSSSSQTRHQMRINARLCYENCFDARKNFAGYLAELRRITEKPQPIEVIETD